MNAPLFDTLSSEYLVFVSVRSRMTNKSFCVIYNYNTCAVILVSTTCTWILSIEFIAIPIKQKFIKSVECSNVKTTIEDKDQ